MKRAEIILSACYLGAIVLGLAVWVWVEVNRTVREREAHEAARTIAATIQGAREAFDA